MVATAAALESALKDVADVDPGFMRTCDKRAVLLGLDRVASQLEDLRLRVMAAAEDVAVDEGARDVAAWLAHRARADRGQVRRDLRLARTLDTRWHRVARALREAEANPAQVEVIVSALDALPDHLDPELVARPRSGWWPRRPGSVRVSADPGPPDPRRGRPRGG